MNNLINIAKILKPHGVKGAVKIQPLIDDDVPFSIFNEVFLGDERIPSKITGITKLNGAFAIKLDTIAEVGKVNDYKFQYISVDRNKYSKYFEDLLVSDLIGAKIQDENGNLFGYIVNVEQYGSADVLTINCNGVGYQIPFVEDIVWRNEKGEFVINKKRFDEVKI
ncbi:MAG: ribosome maturation factor RimM [Clostridia bacterium]|nr:ribosome maturation factor RimM [Clostridia bacterium]